MTDFFSLSPPRSVYTAIPDGDLSLWQSLTAVNSKQCRYELCTRASVGSDASSVFKAFRNLQALSQCTGLNPLTLYCHTHTYLYPGPAKQHGSFTKPKPLSSLSSTSWKHKKRATLSAGRKEQEPASCDLLRSGTMAAFWQMLPFSPQSSRKIADSRHWGGDRPKVRGGSQRENLLWFLQAPPPHTHTQERLSRKRRLMRVILELTIAAILKYDDNDMNSMGQTFEMATRGYGK